VELRECKTALQEQVKKLTYRPSDIAQELDINNTHFFRLNQSPLLFDIMK
jgi:hypothetical protein